MADKSGPLSDSPSDIDKERHERATEVAESLAKEISCDVMVIYVNRRLGLGQFTAALNVDSSDPEQVEVSARELFVVLVKAAQRLMERIEDFCAGPGSESRR